MRSVTSISILLVTLVTTLATSIGMQAAQVNITPGTLGQMVGANPASVKELTITGQLDIRDFEFMVMEMTSLETLDLSNATIAPYEGAPTTLNRIDSPADVLPEGALMIATLRQVKLPKGVTVIGEGALGSSAITSIEIPATVTTIGNKAFSGCTSLTSIEIPSLVTAFGYGVFHNATALKSVKINNALTTLPPLTFEGCSNLQSVDLPATLTTIDKEAFAGCTKLSDIHLPATLKTIGDHAFLGSGIVEVDLVSTSLDSIGAWAFAATPSLETVSLPTTLTAMGKGAFFNSSSLTLAAIPERLTTIADFSLKGVNGTADMSIPEGVTRIGNHALANWKGVQMLTLPKSLESIGDYAMANWTELKTIGAEHLNNVPLLGENVWSGVDQPNVTLKVGGDFKEDFENAPQWQEFHIEAKQDPTEAITAPADQLNIKAYFEGMTLHVVAPSDIASLQVFDLAGRKYNMPRAGKGTHASLDTSAWDTPILIVRVKLAEGTAATLKLSR